MCHDERFVVIVKGSFFPPVVSMLAIVSGVLVCECFMVVFLVRLQRKAAGLLALLATPVSALFGISHRVHPCVTCVPADVPA